MSEHFYQIQFELMCWLSFLLGGGAISASVMTWNRIKRHEQICPNLGGKPDAKPENK